MSAEKTILSMLSPAASCVGHVVDGVVVPAAAPQIGVALVAALQTIVAGAAVEHVLAQEAVNVVVAGGLCRREDRSMTSL